jgi:hypothetical protein
MNRRVALPAVAVFASLAAATPAAQGKLTPSVVRAVHYTTVPPIKGMQLRFPGGRIARTDLHGRASIRLVGTVRRPASNAQRYHRLNGGYFYPRPDVRTLRRADGSIVRFDRLYLPSLISVTQTYRFVPRFVRQGGSPLPPGVIQNYTLKSRTGRVLTIKGTNPVMLQGTRVVPFTGQLVSKDIEWAVQSVMVDGTNVVTRAQSRFSPRTVHGRFDVPLLFFSAQITSSDAIFGNPVGRSVTLTYPSGRKRIVTLSKDGKSNLPGLPRGNFTIKANAPGVSPERPLALSRDQVVDLKVISYLDLALVAAFLGAVAIVLLVVRRPHLRRLGRARAGEEEVAGQPPVEAEPAEGTDDAPADIEPPERVPT